MTHEGVTGQPLPAGLELLVASAAHGHTDPVSHEVIQLDGLFVRSEAA
ncbi:MAG: hypothetical protein JST73_01565 [Actinobacteria bacterium]|nr:hypothetical protein [Actinomycetota bacterium]